MIIEMERKEYIQPSTKVHVFPQMQEHILAPVSGVTEDNNGGGPTTTDPEVDSKPGTTSDFARSFTFWEESWEEDY